MILVFGKTGQVGQALAGLEDVTSLGRAEAEFEDPAACADAIRARRPRAVINAAAYTGVDAAEDDAARADLVNAAAPAAMAGTCAELGIPLVQISTDYVFAGGGDAPHAPGDATGPLGVYGQTKRAGELAIAATGAVHAILRTSWVFAPDHANFVTTMLRLGASRDEIRVVDDQIGGPTLARHIADACHTIANALIDDPALSGTYHFSGAPDVSWAGFARAIFDTAGLACRVVPIPSTAYPTRAARPLNSRLDCTATASAFGLPRPDWRTDLDTMLARHVPKGATP